jgi:hypothetical protein
LGATSNKGTERKESESIATLLTRAGEKEDMMLLWSHDVWVRRTPPSRFTRQQVDEMVKMAHAGASSLEIGAALDLKPSAIRAKLNSMGVRLRRRVARQRLRLVVSVTERTLAAADARGIGVPALIRRLLAVISRDNLFDRILPLPVPHSLGAAAVVDRWHHRPPIMRRIELAGCIGRPQLTVCLAPAHS